MPSVVATEKCAMREGVKAKSANATLAAPSEKMRRVVNHNATPSASPNTVFNGRVCRASHSGAGCIAVVHSSFSHGCCV